MKKVLRPERLDIDPGSSTATDEFNHWLITFEHYLAALNAAVLQFDRLQVLTNLVSPKVYKHFSNVKIYDQALTVLKNVYIKPHNIIAARHELLTCKQKPGESVDQYVIRLQQLSKQCDFQNVTAENYRLELIRDALIAGLSSTSIRLRLLENRNLPFQEAYDQARAQELAYKNSEAYQSSVVSSIATKSIDCTSASNDKTEVSEVLRATSLLNNTTQPRFFCGKNWHPRQLCPAKEVICHFCLKNGHFASVCRKRIKNQQKSSREKLKYPPLTLQLWLELLLRLIIAQ